MNKDKYSKDYYIKKAIKEQGTEIQRICAADKVLQKILTIPIMRNNSTDPLIKISIGGRFSACVFITTLDLDYEWIVKELAGPIHRKLNILWRLTAGGNSRREDPNQDVLTLTSDEPLSVEGYYNKVHIYLNIYERSAKSCRLVKKMEDIITHEDEVSYSWQMDCNNVVSM